MHTNTENIMGDANVNLMKTFPQLNMEGVCL